MDKVTTDIRFVFTVSRLYTKLSHPRFYPPYLPPISPPRQDFLIRQSILLLLFGLTWGLFVPATPFSTPCARTAYRSHDKWRYALEHRPAPPPRLPHSSSLFLIWDVAHEVEHDYRLACYVGGSLERMMGHKGPAFACGF